MQLLLIALCFIIAVRPSPAAVIIEERTVLIGKTFYLPGGEEIIIPDPPHGDCFGPHCTCGSAGYAIIMRSLAAFFYTTSVSFDSLDYADQSPAESSSYFMED